MFAFLLAAALAGSEPGQSSQANAVVDLSAASFAPSVVILEAGGHVSRASDGLFYVTGAVNGISVRFLIDTGASATVLTREDAIRAGLLSGKTEFRALADTANGSAAVAWVSIAELRVDGIETQDVSAAVASGDLSVSLLGQDWLSRLDSVTIAGDRMVLRY